MDGAADDPVWKLRRAVLAGLLVIGVVTTGYAFVVTRPADTDQPTAQDPAPTDVVTAVRPSDEGEGPLRLGRILVVGRHGDPVAKPEHTAESYADALDAGVDYVEAEVVMSSDNRLVLRSSNQLRDTTDVADRPEFADRLTTKLIGGESFEDWFTEDFTLNELRSLRAIEPEPEQRPESAARDGEYPLLAFDDLLTQVREAGEEQGRDIGVFVRPLRPDYFRELGLPLEPAIAASLRRARLVLEPERVTIESNDTRVLERMEDLVGDNVLTAFIVETGNPDALSATGLEELADTIDAVSVSTGAFAGLRPCEVGPRVHEAGLALMVYPISYENALLTSSFRNLDDPAPGARGDLLGQLRGLRDVQVDVVLAESPRDVVDALAELADDPELQESLCD